MSFFSYSSLNTLNLLINLNKAKLALCNQPKRYIDNQIQASHSLKSNQCVNLSLIVIQSNSRHIRKTSANNEWLFSIHSSSIPQKGFSRFFLFPLKYSNATGTALELTHGRDFPISDFSESLRAGQYPWLCLSLSIYLPCPLRPVVRY